MNNFRYFEIGLKLLLLAIAMATVECVDRKKMESTPPPQKAFDVDKYMGNWYEQVKLPPCSWAGSSEFTNYVAQYSKQSGGIVNLKDTWRSSDCVTSILILTPNDLPGVFKLKDPIGDVISGKNVVVATDYKKFAVKWGCTKFATDGSCPDPYIIVKTRKRDPSPHTWKVIAAILEHYWKLSLPEMVRVIHDKDACVKFKEPVQQLLKTY